jgi:O-antigen ligase
LGKQEKSLRKLNSKASDPSSRFDQIVLLGEDLALAGLFLGLALAFSTQVQVHFTLPKLVALRTGTLILIVLFILRLRKGEIRSLPRTVLWGGVALGAWWIVSTFFALHLPTALEGAHGRYNGLWTQENYLLLFFMAATLPLEAHRVKRLLILFITALIPVGLYALVQFLQWDPIPWSTRWSRSVSTIGHGVPLAAILGLAVPPAILFYFRAKGGAKKILWGSLLLLFILAGLSTLSRGPWIGTLAGSALILFILFKSHLINLRSAALPLALILIVPAVFVLLAPGGLGKISNRFHSLTLGAADPSTFGRMIYYRAAWQGWKDHPLTGVGPESFHLVYPKYRPAEDSRVFSDTIPTMVHNGYLQAALTTGAPGLAAYLFFLGSAAVFLIRRFSAAQELEEKLLLGALLGSLGSFLIQDFTGWPEVALTPFFWILLGLAVSLANRSAPRPVFSPWVQRTGVAFAALALVFLGYASVKAFNLITADRQFRLAQAAEPVDRETAEAHIEKGLAAVPGDPAYEDQAAILYMRLLERTGDAGLYRKGLACLDQARRQNPFDPYVLIHRIEIDAIALQRKVIENPSAGSREAGEKLTVLDRNNPTVYLTLARLKIREQKYEQALGFINQANSLNRLAPCPREEWVAAKRGLAVQCAKKGDLPSALQNAREIVGQFPDEVSSHAFLGYLYGAMEQPVKARESFETALKLDPNHARAKEGLQRLHSTGMGKISG